MVTDERPEVTHLRICLLSCKLEINEVKKQKTDNISFTEWQDDVFYWNKIV
jgi:hypothetical protein